MKYKLLVADFDDTLLRSDFTLSETTLKAIDEFIARGGIFTVATGRMYCSLLTFLDKLHVNAPVAAYQGALVVDSATSKILYSCNMENSLTVSVLKWLEEKNLYAQFYFADKLYVRRREEHTKFYEKISNVVAIETNIPLSEYALKNNIGATKILVMLYAEQGEKTARDISEHFGECLSVNRTKTTFIEITNSLASKAAAVKFIAEERKIQVGEIVCVGDSYNDVSMINFAGLGVAMGNAFEDVKKIADLTIDTNDNDGVAKLIYSLLSDEL